MNFKKLISVLIVALLVLSQTATYFAAVHIAFDVTFDDVAGTITVSSSVYGDYNDEPHGLTVNYEVVDEYNNPVSLITSSSSTVDSQNYTVIDSVYYYKLNPITFNGSETSPNYTVNAYVNSTLLGTNNISIPEDPSGPVQVTGTVFAPDGVTPVNGGSVEVKQSYNHVDTTFINSDGTFGIGGLPDGTYHIIARPAPETGYCVSNPVEIVISGGVYTAPADGLKLIATNQQFSGTVLNPDETNANSGNVEIKDEYGKFIDWVMVGTDGVFRAGGLTDGKYILIAKPFEDSQYSSSKEVIIEISSGAIVGQNPVLTYSVPQVTGQVFDPNGTALTFGWVEVRSSTGEMLPGVGIDSSGYFRIGGLNDGKYSIKAMQWEAAFTPSEEVQVDILNGQYTQPTGGLKLYLTQPQLSGKVVKSDGVTLAPMSWVEVKDAQGWYITGSGTNSEGKFFIGGLKEGSYLLKANPPWDDKNQSPSIDIPIVVDVNGVVTYVNASPYAGEEITINLNQPQVTGTVADPNGNPVQWGYVELQKIEGSYETWLSGVGIQEGAFALGGLADGIYRIKANPDHNSQFTASQQFEFKIESGALVVYGSYTGDLIVLELQGPQLTGTVVDPAGNPVKYGWVEVKGSNGEWFGGSPINEFGGFKIGGLSDGDYYLIAWPEWGSTFTSSAEVPVAISGGSYTAPQEGLILTLGSPQIFGEVVAPDGTPQAYGYVEVRNANGMHVKGSGVDHTGFFTIGGLADGTYYIKANPDYSSEYSASGEVEVKIINGMYSSESLILVLKSAQLTGSVVEPDGSTLVNNGWVSVETADGRWVNGAPVNNGTFRIGALESGIYTLRAFPDWNASFGESDRVSITIDSTGQYTGSAITLRLNNPQVNGIVKGPAGSVDQENIMPYGFVEVKTQEGMYMSGSGVNHNGEFKLSGLEPGTYIIKAMPGGDTNYSASAETTIVIDANGNFTGSNPFVVNLTNAQISGTVRDPEGNIAKHGYAEVTNANGDWVLGVPVNYNGVFAVGGLSDGTYYIKVYPDYMSQSYSASLPVEVVISSGACTTDQGQGAGNITVNLSRIQLTGTVMEPGVNGSAVKMGWIEVQKSDGQGGWTWEGGTGINWEGQFSLGGLNDGTYRIKAYPEWMDSTYSASSYVEVVVVSGQVTTVGGQAYDAQQGATLTLTAPQINGTVTGPNGESVGFGWVEIRNSLDDSFVTGIGTKEDGTFQIGGLSNGTYTITAYPGWKSQFTPSEGYSITITNDTFGGNPLTLTLESAQATGTVVDPNNLPVTWGWVEVHSSSGIWVKSTGVDENGQFRLSGLQDGNYKIQAFPEMGSEFASSQKVDITVSGGIVTSPAEIKLTLTNPSLLGTVLRPDGLTNATGGWVEIGDINANWLVSVPISKDGTFKLPELSPGQYKIQAFPKDGSAYSSSNIIDLTINENGSFLPDPLELTFNNPL